MKRKQKRKADEYKRNINKAKKSRLKKVKIKKADIRRAEAEMKKRNTDNKTPQQTLIKDFEPKKINYYDGFWEHVKNYEKAPYKTYLEQFTEMGLNIPAPEKIDDKKLSKKLWEIIYSLVEKEVFLCHTDHLNDRELYTKLYTDTLQANDVKELPPTPGATCIIDLVSGGSDEANDLYLKYYASESEREIWQSDWPEDKIPEHEELPYDRDRLLPAE